MKYKGSLFKRISHGLVVCNKKLSEKIIEVMPVEILPFTDSELDDMLSVVSGEGVDGRGNTYMVKVKSGISVEATWLPFGSNRLLAPDVRRGERVDIWQYADEDKYYWSELGLDDNLRCLETVIFAFSDVSSDGKDHVLTVDNCYTLEFSTHTKHVTLSTAVSDGELFKYTMQLNPGNSTASFTDNVGNTIQINSADTIVNLINADMSQVILSKKDIYMHADDKIFITCDHFKVTAKTDIIFNTKSWSATATKSITFDTVKMDVTAKDAFNLTTKVLTVTAPTSTFSGAVIIGGGLAVTGICSGKGGGSMQIPKVKSSSIETDKISGGTSTFKSSDSNHYHVN